MLRVESRVCFYGGGSIGRTRQDTAKAAFFLAGEDLGEGMDMPLQAWKMEALASLKKGKSGQNKSESVFKCLKCDRKYKRKDSLQRHVTWECNVDPKFQYEL